MDLKRPQWSLWVLVALVASASLWWVLSAPPEYLALGPPYVMSDPPDAILELKAAGDPIGDSIQTIGSDVQGYDDIVLQENLQRALVTGRDGWIWIVHLDTGIAERWVDVPLMAAGAHAVPGDDDRICFCSSRLYGVDYPPSERVGLYELEISTKTVTPLMTQVPLPPAHQAPIPGNQGTVFTEAAAPRLKQSDMHAANSRPLAFCNDLAMSHDGRYIYVSEPFPYEGASMGEGAFGEAITLGKNGRLWRLDRETEEVTLVAQNYTFIDGVLLEEKNNAYTDSILITETVKFRILRLFVAGEKAGQDEIVWQFLPGLPDGMERDEYGRIWIGMIKTRSPLITWAHAHPWIKPLMLRIPLSLLPVPTTTAIMALSPDAATILYYAEHSGTRVHDIAAVVPGTSRLYLANFSDLTPGLHSIPNPLPSPDAQDRPAHEIDDT